MSTLLTKPMGGITSDDVLLFCDPQTGFPENQTLEYKGGGDLPSSAVLGKTVSAMANTFGGTLILGVDEDHKSGRPVKISGIRANRELEKQIFSILLDNITPALVPLPEMQIVQLPDDAERVVVVMRVAQSNATPHAARNGSGHQHVYVRIGNESRPTNPEEWEVPASPERLEWLFSHRRKSEELRDQLIHEALDRTEVYFERGLFPAFSSQRPTGQGLFWAVPRYPQGPVAKVQELYNKCVDTRKGTEHKLVVQSVLDGGEFPRYGLMQPRTTQNSVIGFGQFGEHAIRSYEFNVCGMLLYQETFGGEEINGPSRVPALDFLAVASQLSSFLQLAAQFYNETDPIGLLQLHVIIKDIDGLCVLSPDPNRILWEQAKDWLPYQRAIDCDRVERADRLRDESVRRDLLFGLLCEIGSAFNRDQKYVQKALDRTLARSDR